MHAQIEVSRQLRFTTLVNIITLCLLTCYVMKDYCKVGMKCHTLVIAALDIPAVRGRNN